jgi:hypothetical protein
MRDKRLLINAPTKRGLFLAHLYGPAARCKPKAMTWR